MHASREGWFVASCLAMATLSCGASPTVGSGVVVAAPAASPPPPPGCGVIDVDDHSVSPSEARVALVRNTVRQKLFVLHACNRPYRVRVNVTVDQQGTGRLQASLRAVVFKMSGEMVGDIPNKLSAEHAAPEDRAARESELLRTGADSLALLFNEHFR